MTSQNTLEGMSGREASQLRRRMLSQGKAALPVASERVRSGFREADMPAKTTPADAKVTMNTVVSPPPAPASPAAGGVATGRAASIERRRALSKGKAALPGASERLRSGFREASLPGTTATAQPSAPQNSNAGSAPQPKGGREASIARRRALSKGKAALPAASERVRSGFREADMPRDVAQAPMGSSMPDPSSVDLPGPAPERLSGREIAQMYRARRAKLGNGEQSCATQAQAARQGEMSYPRKVHSVTTAVANATVTGLSYASGRAMTGAEAGHDKPLTGTQYVGGTEGGYRASAGKVGHARTGGGQTVSGTMVRSGVRITGDEDNADLRITGNADQKFTDVEGRGESIVPTGAQFARQSQPHGTSVFGTNLGRSARSVGSRSRDTERAVEQTLAGHSVSGTAIGRSARVTGDENGSAHSLTGSQYLAPASQQAMSAPEGGRADPASGGKVTASQTWGGQTITGPEMERDRRVTGSEHGACQTLTGTPYYGASGAQGWCDPETACAEDARRAKQMPRAITGNVPLNDPMVSGTGRGADRNITGSSYFVAAERGREDDGDPVCQSIAGFSVMSPQRETHLQARATRPAEEQAPSAITGTFARGEGKVTGNAEFHAPRRSGAGGGQSGQRPARGNITGEGSTRGANITGSAWSENRHVTGTEDFFAAGRNPSERSGSANSFAGARSFKSKAPHYDPVSPVTGATGGTPASGATVTLSGGAAG
ncbi:hypothetical protein BV394_09885 [Brevirhabdus pacifica]|uniref:Uncharacterized protein n=3 Tax=Brevirhabdus pacifica TaxID=1267768 RepID=A0A1U7DJE1_9RHOB|nr:CsoS2 family carboxysome shell protein [Brevirhabdus pacifica]APX89988.1 hypothetical protein BV394_09885 [Brevirhabdus pacifica]OWU75410.1 hypothetical protein ATO5_12510 [Loktanella sp. 22II-4b]PJJ82773.1 carboxysome shell peptide [Brevirhabdus pacifica]